MLQGHVELIPPLKEPHLHTAPQWNVAQIHNTPFQTCPKQYSPDVNPPLNEQVAPPSLHCCYDVRAGPKKQSMNIWPLMHAVMDKM